MTPNTKITTTTPITISSEQLISSLNWRYATKQFDKKKLSKEQEKTLFGAISLTPTSYGIEPYEVFVVENPKVREQLRKVSWNQAQVTDASHLLVFAGKTTITEKDIDEFFARTAKTRGIDVATLDGYKKMILGDLVQGPRSKIIGEWAKRQAYIALGNAMTSAALLGLDSCPMEGLDPVEYDKILDLPKKGYNTVVVLAVGFRSSEDKYAQLKKVRKSDKLFVRV